MEKNSFTIIKTLFLNKDINNRKNKIKICYQIYLIYKIKN